MRMEQYFSYTDARVIELGPLTVWFFGCDPIAFQIGDDQLVIPKNAWGVTTGRCLDAIEPKHEKRVAYSRFERELAELEQRLCLALKAPTA